MWWTQRALLEKASVIFIRTTLLAADSREHLIASLSFHNDFFCLLLSFFPFFFFNDERSNLRCVVPRSVWLCCLVSVKTLKSYFTLHNAHFLSFYTHFISLFIRPWQSNIIISPQKENEWEDDDDKRNVTRANFQPTHQKKIPSYFQLMSTRRISPTLTNLP